MAAALAGSRRSGSAEGAIRRALRRLRQIPDGLGFFPYEKFRARLQAIIGIGGLSVESVSAA
jgi:hypothetical protein